MLETLVILGAATLVADLVFDISGKAVDAVFSKIPVEDDDE